jgi:hypothetical protein
MVCIGQSDRWHQHDKHPESFLLLKDGMKSVPCLVFVFKPSFHGALPSGSR